jgi:hypothetical protein
MMALGGQETASVGEIAPMASTSKRQFNEKERDK